MRKSHFNTFSVQQLLLNQYKECIIMCEYMSINSHGHVHSWSKYLICGHVLFVTLLLTVKSDGIMDAGFYKKKTKVIVMNV